MKVFFSTTQRLKIKYDENVKAIFKAIESLGHKHTSDYIVRIDIKDYYKLDKEKTPQYYNEIVESLRRAEVVVLETSLHSIGVGYLLQLALDQGKCVIALHIPGKFPFFISGIQNEKLMICEYTIENVKEVLKQALEVAKDQMDVRFNFFISPRIGAYLDWIAKTKRIPRAVYLRRLIEGDMAKSNYLPAEERNKKKTER